MNNYWNNQISSGDILYNLNINTIFLLVILIASNLVPLAGVVFMGWSIATVMFIYWFENIIVGFFNLLKMRIAEKPIATKLVMPQDREYSQREKNGAVSTAFMFHYGLFVLGHGVFVYGLFIKDSYLNDFVAIAILALIINYIIEYYVDYVGERRYLHVAADELMKEPYPRLLVLHIAIILGGLFVLEIGNQNIWPLVVLVILKTSLDLVVHIKKDKMWLSKHISFD